MHDPLRFLIAVVALVLSATGAATTPAPGTESPPGAAFTLFRNVRIFDGKGAKLTEPRNVMVHGNVIERISSGTPPMPADAKVTVIDGGGRTLMPGLIDAHVHAMLIRPTPQSALTSDPGYLNLLAAAEATDMLMRGFTTVRDLGGPTFGLKRAIDEGLVAGPRIFPAGATIATTSGHGDFRQLSELPRVLGGTPSRMEALGASMIADSPDEVRVRAREQLMLGASHIKLMGGGGVASPHSPLDVLTFTEPELRAAVEAAENWGTYVAVHAHTSAAIKRAIAAGVKCIEHGHLMDESTAKLIAEKGVWLSTQPIPEEAANAFPRGSVEWEKAQEVTAGTSRVYGLAKKYRLKTAFGTDILFAPALAPRQGAMLAGLARWYTPAEVLVMATRTNGELLALSGKRSPYAGKLGVVEEGALADLLVVDGDPTANINLVADPARSFLVIMKDGKIFKNTLPH